MRIHHIHQSVQNWHLVTGVGYNKNIVLVSVSWQSIFGQGKLTTVLVQLTLWNSCIKFCKNCNTRNYLTFILDNQFEKAKTAKSVLPSSGTWILAKFVYFKLFNTWAIWF